ncbi:hypothetical protein G9A89_005742 [Geosiphon pyriformis]|nr:hypothetical protein G9A89_005742 [Geosiphon pyriformis]
MEITDNIYSLVQQIFQLIQHQEMEITINQQTIRYKNITKIPQNKAQKRLENVVDKIMTKIKLAIKKQQIVRLHPELTRETWTWIYGGTNVKKSHWYTLTEDIVPEESSIIKLSKQLAKLWCQETTDKLLSSSPIALSTKLRVCYSLNTPKNHL